MKKHILLASCVLLLAGCAKSNPSVDKYKANMDIFFENIEQIDNSINNLNPDSSNAADSSKRMLLEYLDILDTSFSEMSQVELPEGYEALGELSKQASADMTQAVTYFHNAYDEKYNQGYEQAAYEYYIKANKELKTIVKALHGEYSSDNPTTDNEDEYQSILLRDSEEDDYSIYLEDEYEDYYEAYGEDNPQDMESEEITE